MNKPNLPKIAKSLQIAMVQHSPEILTGIGIAGMVTTTILAVKATPKALILMDSRRQEEKEYKLKPVEVIKITWKCYVPAVVTCSLSIACLVGASSVNARRNTALATAYKLSQTAFTEYQEKVVETIGEKKEQVVRDSIAKDRIEKDPVGRHEVIITEKGNTLCYDSVMDRYFRSDVIKIKKAENELNRRMMDEMYISLNDFYYELGVKSSKLGADLGWNISNGFIDVSFSTQLSEDDQPCIVLDYRVEPRYNFCELI